jgi:hypothetical protein
VRINESADLLGIHHPLAARGQLTVMSVATPSMSESAVFKWALRLSAVAFAGQIIVALLAVGLLLASLIPPFQSWVATRYADTSSLMLPQILILLLYLPLSFTKVMRSRGIARSWRGVLTRFPRVSRILLALGFSLLVFNLWFISQWPRDLLYSATTTEALAVFQAEYDLHSVRGAAMTALYYSLIYMGLGYQWRWLAHQRGPGNAEQVIDSGIVSSTPDSSYR